MRILFIILFSFSTAYAQMPAKGTFHFNNQMRGCVDADVCAYQAAVNTNGGNLTPTEITALDAMVASLKSNSLWTKFTAIYPMVGGTRASMMINLKTPGTFNLTVPAGSPSSYTSTGMTKPTGGVTNTGINPLSVLSNTSGHLAFYCRSNTAAGGQYDMGASDDAGAVTKPVAVIIRYTGNVTYGLYGNGSYATSASNSDARGFFMANYESGVSRIFKNGTSLDNTTEACALPNRDIYLFAINAGGTESFISAKECAFASIGSGFTTGEAATLYTIVQQFQTDLARNV